MAEIVDVDVETITKLKDQSNVDEDEQKADIEVIKVEKIVLIEHTENEEKEKEKIREASQENRRSSEEPTAKVSPEIQLGARKKEPKKAKSDCKENTDTITIPQVEVSLVLGQSASFL